ncbi:hypothetical protein ASE48_10175 [Mycobacterium sp. Root265]|uniref:hypothetical protein n=1 Tax=Mycobacterium sp. Root265 TaxID=1736504 RepID=UPI00070ED44B|nr:hypothetical protein [Mycobacterium sp. Root265]KRD07794.1 hypothetical protein ASE48_10175 [Mycobacterium sp. Root265]
MSTPRAKRNTNTVDTTNAVSPAELAPVELDPPDPVIARWQGLADIDLLINHDDDAEKVIPLPRPAWADPLCDVVGHSVCSSSYNTDYAAIPLTYMGGESHEDSVLPSRLSVRGRLIGCGWLGVGMTVTRYDDGEWREAGCTMTLSEARDLIEVLSTAVEMIGADQ